MKNNKFFKLQEDIISEMNEQLYLRSDIKTNEFNKPIFIIGLPRSGTTLLEQIIIHVFKLGYIDNIIAKFWNCPEFGIAVSNSIAPFKDRNQMVFESNYGSTKETLGPHEFGYFWRRFFDYSSGSHEVKELTEMQSTELKESFEKIGGYFSTSFVFKNPVAITLNVEILNNLLPDALFIFITRDRLEIAQSILKARKIYNGSEKEWFSGVPQECLDSIENGSPVKQVAKQVHCYEKIINRILKQNNKGNVLEIKFDDLIENTEEEISKIGDFLNENQIFCEFIGKIPSDKIDKNKSEITNKEEFEKAFKEIEG